MEFARGSSCPWQERDNEQQQVSKWEVRGARGVVSWSGFFSARSRALGPGGRARCRRRSARRRRRSARSAALRGRLRARNGPQIRLHARHGRDLEGPEVAALRRGRPAGERKIRIQIVFFPPPAPPRPASLWPGPRRWGGSNHRQGSPDFRRPSCNQEQKKSGVPGVVFPSFLLDFPDGLAESRRSPCQAHEHPP